VKGDDETKGDVNSNDGDETVVDDLSEVDGKRDDKRENSSKKRKQER
jgi:hypothetical protein